MSTSFQASVDKELFQHSDKDAEIARLRGDLEYYRSCFRFQVTANEMFTKLITELALGIDAVQQDTCTLEDWDALNRCAQRAMEATKP